MNRLAPNFVTKSELVEAAKAIHDAFTQVYDPAVIGMAVRDELVAMVERKLEQRLNQHLDDVRVLIESLIKGMPAAQLTVQSAKVVQVLPSEVSPVFQIDPPKKMKTTKSIVYEGNRPAKIIEESESE